MHSTKLGGVLLWLALSVVIARVQESHLFKHRRARLMLEAYDRGQPSDPMAR